MHVKLWVKSDGDFESDETLSDFLADVKGLALAFDTSFGDNDRYNYQNIPKYLIYAIKSLQVNDSSQLPMIMFGKGKSQRKDVKYKSNFKKVR